MRKMVQLIVLVILCILFGVSYYGRIKMRREEKLKLARRLAEIQQSIPVVGFPTSEQPVPKAIITDKTVLECLEKQFTNKGNFYL